MKTRFSFIFIITLLSTIIMSRSNCAMITDNKFKPYTQAKNPALTHWRAELRNNINPTTGEIPQNGDYFHHCDVIGKIPEEKTNKFLCYQYAIQETTGFKEFVTTKDGTQYLFVADYFQATPHPQPNDLAIYGLMETFPVITHFAVANDSVTYRSKFDALPHLREHRLFDIPENYGTAVWFFTLKPKYQTPEGKKLLLNDIEEKKQIFLKKSINKDCVIS
jgi:hypothetical protein